MIPKGHPLAGTAEDYKRLQLESTWSPSFDVGDDRLDRWLFDQVALSLLPCATKWQVLADLGRVVTTVRAHLEAGAGIQEAARLVVPEGDRDWKLVLVNETVQIWRCGRGGWAIQIRRSDDRFEWCAGHSFFPAAACAASLTRKGRPIKKTHFAAFLEPRCLTHLDRAFVNRLVEEGFVTRDEVPDDEPDAEKGQTGRTTSQAERGTAEEPILASVAVPEGSATKRGQGGRATDMLRAVKALEGILRGIAVDGEINDDELASVGAWLETHRNLADEWPFCELARVVPIALRDGVLEESEREELLGYCQRFPRLQTGADLMTEGVRELHGFLQGIACDRRISDGEVRGIASWLDRHRAMQGTWPYDDVAETMERILSDGQVTAEERGEVLALCQRFSELPTPEFLSPDAPKAPWMQSDAPVVETVGGICDASPNVAFGGRVFCFTGQMRSGTRRSMEELVERRGGAVQSGVTRQTDYLVVGANSSPCWAYAPYGRKIESVMKLRRTGTPVAIVSEDDFLAAVERHLVQLELV